MSILEKLEARFEKENGIIGFIYDEVKDFQPSGSGWDMGTNKLNILTRSVKLLHNDTKPYYYSKVALNCFWCNYQDKYEPHKLSNGKWVFGPNGGGNVNGHYPLHNLCDTNYGLEIKDLIFCMIPVDDICTPVKNYKKLEEEYYYDDYDYDPDYDCNYDYDEDDY